MRTLAESVIVRCTELGVAEWVVCSGARNVPLLEVLAHAEGIKIWSHFDERAAGFFALGRIQATGLPVAVVTTSGSAVAELLPACIEAYYQGRPLILINADREPEFRGSGAPQTMEQPGIFGEHVGLCFDWTDKDVESQEAWEKATASLKNWYGNIPVQMNVCFAEPVLGSTPRILDLYPGEAPHPAPFRENVSELALFLKNEAWRGMVILIGGLDPDEQDPVLWLCEELGVPVWADATSGLRETLKSLSLEDADVVLREGSQGDGVRKPHGILRIGDIPTCRFWRDLENMPEIKVFSLTRTGFSGLGQRPSTVIKGTMDAIIRALGDVLYIGDAQDALLPGRKRKGLIHELMLSLPESEPALLKTLSLYAALGDRIFLGNSMPIREWNLVAQTDIETPFVRANRGINGIDGQIASFLGMAADIDSAWGIFGDLTALYDANALAMQTQLPPKGHYIVAVVNNRGGRIFERLPGGSAIDKKLEALLIQPHEWSVQALAELWKVNYHPVHTADDLEFEPEEGLTLLEIFPDASQTARFWELYARK